MKSIIETTGLSKKFGDTLAVNKVSLHIRPSEIYGFLGLNGAGKTTTIRLLLGMIKPDQGDIILFGEKLKKTGRIWNEIGYMVETPYSYPNLTVLENLSIVCKLRGLSYKNTVPEIIEKLNLGPYQNKKAKHLSLGNNQRLGLAKALIHKPKLLILDEPVNGLDPAGIVEIRELLLHLAKNEGSTIFISSHILSEIAKLTTRIGIVDHGRLLKELNSEDLDTLLCKKLIINTVNNEQALSFLNKSGYEFIQQSDHLECISQDVIEAPEKISTSLVNAGIPPRELHVYEEDLESYFLRVIEP